MFYNITDKSDIGTHVPSFDIGLSSLISACNITNNQLYSLS